MKAALVFALATAASAVQVLNCRIPTPYVSENTVGGVATCAGNAAGYNVYGVCLTGLDRAAYNVAAATEVRTLLVQSNTAQFTAAGAGNSAGCSVPSFNNDWNTPTATVTALTNGGACSTIASPLSAANAGYKGAAIECATDYYPTQGWEGTALCASVAAVGPYPAIVTPTQSDFWFTDIVLRSNAANAANAVSRQVAFSGPNALVCSQACNLPAGFCANGALTGNIVGAGTGLNTAACTLRPTRPGVFETSFSFRCASAAQDGQLFTSTCTNGVLSTPGYVAQCGAGDGAQSIPLFNNNGNLDKWATVQTQLAGEIRNFNLVDSTMGIAFPVNLGASSTLRYWNNNPAQLLQAGNVYGITVNGCAALVGDLRTQCVQQTLNWWRCEEHFPMFGAHCVAGGVTIACPTHELGFRCPSSSKKGLWGLLGLLAIIPLVLLCCCLLFLCCIRRRKTEADVHFATFDPHAAPVVATAPCATATAMPMGMGMSPYATSAMPVM